jgi:hypothetical protein
MAKIDNIDLGTITSLEQVEKQTVSEQENSMSVQTLIANMNLQTHEWRFEGFLIDPTQAALESLENVRNNALLTLIDMTDIDARVIGYGKLIYFRKIRGEDEATIVSFEGIFRLQIAIGATSISNASTTTNAYLHDLDYRAKLTRFDPNIGRFNRTWSSDRLTYTCEFYLDDYSADAFANLVFEMQCGDDIYSATLWAWKSGAWSSIGVWGTGGTSWGAAGTTWYDENDAPHIVKIDNGVRGASLGIGTVSLSLGCNKRILVYIENFLPAATNDHVSTKYFKNQLKLKVQLVHTSIEALRPYPRITYVSGGVEEGAP